MSTAAKSPRYERVTRWHDFERTRRGVLLNAETDAGTPTAVSFEFVEAGIVRVRMSPGKLGPPRSHLLVREEQDWETVPFLVTESHERLELTSRQLRVEVYRSPWAIHVLSEAGETICHEGRSVAEGSPAVIGRPAPLSPGMGFLHRGGEQVWVYGSMRLTPDEDLYGLGGQFCRLNRVGQRFDLWATNAFGLSRRVAYKNIPFLWSTHGCGLFINTTHRVSFDLGATALLSYSFAHEGPELDVFVIYGPEPATILNRYATLTGRAPVPPRWTFGLWVSPHDHRGRAGVEQVAEQLRARDIPCDVIHLDSHWMGEDNARRCGWRWDEERFPDPAGMIAGLRAKGFRVSLWECPYVAEGASIFKQGLRRGYFVRDREGKPYLIRPLGPAGPPMAVVDFTNPEAVLWWQSFHGLLIGQGVSVFETDFGEDAPADGVYAGGMSGREVHNLYPLLYNRTAFDVTAEATGEGVVWGRSGWAGMQRTPVCWGGEPPGDFPYMAHQLRAALSLGLSGVPFYGHDIGGTVGQVDAELYIRWTQWGVFSSHVRCHGTSPREPWAFGEEAEAVFRHYVRLRYRLLPYIYSMAVQSAQAGLPLMRALVLKYLHDPNVRHLDGEYLFGDSFLVAPVLERGAQRRMVYLPAGEWVDYWSREIYAGPTWLNYPAPLSILPLFVRRGAIIPLGPAVDFTDQETEQGLAFEIYPAGEGRFTLYDEGRPPVEVSYTDGDQALQVSIAGHLAAPPVVVLNHFPTVRRVAVNHRLHDRWRAEGGGVVIELDSGGPAEIIVWR